MSPTNVRLRGVVKKKRAQDEKNDDGGGDGRGGLRM
jgi:hypothetical protein